MGAGDGELTVSVPFGFIRLHLRLSSIIAAGRLIARPSILSGECLLVDRLSGLALDSTTDDRPRVRQRPVMWTVHGAPWQRWRLRRAGKGAISITSVHSGLSLTTDNPPGGGSWVWLDHYRGSTEQLWRVRRTPDGSSYQISSSTTSFMLDSGKSPAVPAAAEGHDLEAPSSPFISSNWGDENQKWSILRVT